ncbi:MAG: tRNA pseudouridine(38-40) synthase TruA [Puniceicoccales bacterium]|jgi:tRNA pseudouridine38-40 synthase|nr:tRNA pseudouridine(38-40) synthase TruA [Puniceicoccales bacterium]
MTRWCCVCAYDGTGFHGWQSQPNKNTIQDTIEQWLFYIFKKNIRIFGSGRTDAGVHANNQVFHFDADWKHGENKLLLALDSKLPKNISIKSIQKVENNFHAQFSVIKKRYVYRLREGIANPFEYKFLWELKSKKLDIQKMNTLGQALLGCHDFIAFGAKRKDDKNECTIKTMHSLSFSRQGNYITLSTEASGYLYKMVRTIVGTMVEVGIGALSQNYVLECFTDKQRKEKIVTAPALGLFLDKVYY